MLLTVRLLHADQVNWSTPTQYQLTNSAGQVLTHGASGWVFEVGGFAALTPTAANTTQWAAAWRPLGRGGYNSEIEYLAGVIQVTSNAAPFRATDQGYIWGYNAAVTNGQWILITNSSWQWPLAGTVFDPPLNWVIDPENGSVAIVGSISLTGLRTQGVATSPFPRTNYNAWELVSFLGNDIQRGLSSPNADPDEDGIPNLTEFAMGTEPNRPDPAGLNLVMGGQGANMTLSTQLSPFIVGPNITLQESSSLAPGSWVTSAGTATLSAAGLWTASRARGAGHLFYRLRLSR
jgi:hypothetical protein